MILFPSTRNIAIALHILFFHATLGLSLPTNHNDPSHPAHTRAVDEASRATISKRAISSAVGGIAGGVIGLILLSLFIGLGAASIAILGSLEWGEWRGKTPEDKKGDGEKNIEQGGRGGGGRGATGGQSRPPPVPRKDDEPVTNEKPRPGKSRLSSARLTLKSFTPLDFRSGWLPKSGR